MHEVENWVLAHAGDWWVYPLAWALSCIDGFFPTVPSESVLVSLGALARDGYGPVWWGIVIAGWLGALCGDHIAYWIGAALGRSRLAFLRGEKMQAMIDAAQKQLESRAFTLFMTARFIPLGRTAVNIAAGTCAFPRRHFTRDIAVATGVWALYPVGIGMIAGAWFHAHPLAGVGVAFVVALALSFVGERLAHAVQRKWRVQRPHDDTGEQAEKEPAPCLK